MSCVLAGHVGGMLRVLQDMRGSGTASQSVGGLGYIVGLMRWGTAHSLVGSVEMIRLVQRLWAHLSYL
jgi:hypothetical protein